MLVFFHLPATFSLFLCLEMGKPKCFDIKIQNRRFHKSYHSVLSGNSLHFFSLIALL